MKANEVFVRNADVSAVHYLLHFLELLGRAVRRFGAGNEEFDGDAEILSNICSLEAVREGMAGNPSSKGLVRNVAILRNYFLGFPLGFYHVVNTFPKCDRLVFHEEKYRTKCAKMQQIT